MKERRWPRRTVTVGCAVVGLIWLLWIVGQITRDATWLTAFCFYIPSLAVVILLGVAAASLRLIGDRRRAVWALAAALPPLFFVAFIENAFFWWGRESPTGAETELIPFRLVHWNVWGGGFDWGAMQQELAEREADIYVLSEIPTVRDSLKPLLQQLGDQYSVVRYGSMAIVARGRIKRAPETDRIALVKVIPFDWEYRGRTTHLFAVDVASRLRHARNPLLRELVAKIADEQPDLVVGDFNSPRRSWALSDLPSGYRHAYDAVGTGWGYSWPVPLPMFSLDHCLFGPRVTPKSYDLRSSTLSDHRIQTFEFWLKSE